MPDGEGSKQGYIRYHQSIIIVPFKHIFMIIHLIPLFAVTFNAILFTLLKGHSWDIWNDQHKILDFDILILMIFHVQVLFVLA